jgi:hypothetical protein
VLDDLKESAHEKMLRERKAALNRLFDKANLQPGTPSATRTGTGGSSKRSLVEKYDAAVLSKKKAGEEEEGEEMNENQLNLVCMSYSLTHSCPLVY